MRTLLQSFVLFSVVYSNKAQESECQTPDGGVGVCRPIEECPKLLENQNLAQNNKVPQDVKAKIYYDLSQRNLKCYDDSYDKYCCSNCTTPDGKSGIIKDIRACQHLLDTMLTQTTQNIKYVNEFRVGYSLNFCCGPSSQGQTSSECDSTISQPPNPTSKCCGVDISTGPRIMGGQVTGVDLYPWAVVLDYERGRSTSYCGGSLITNKHVVTAAHCIKYTSNGPPKYVRVGEYDKENPGRDCKTLPDESQECNEGAEVVNVEAYIVHPAWNRITRLHDIGLLRLQRQVRYTGYVRPICLPSSDVSEANTKFIVTGWGAGSNTTRFKQDLPIKAVDLEVCRERTPWLIDSQICAGGEEGKDSCSGDSGGPLMHVVSGVPHYELAGVVSYGPSQCGVLGKPAVYTKVFHYVNWIQYHVRYNTENWKSYKEMDVRN